MKLSLLKDVALFTAVLLIGFGLVTGVRYYFNANEQGPAVIETDLSQHFVNTQQKVILYTTSWCGYCKQTKQLLTDLEISFMEYDIEKSEQLYKDRYASLGSSGVPKILINNTLINGFYPEEIESALIKQKLLVHIN